MVVKGDIPSSELMPEALNEYIRCNTYLSWDDPWFWEKLRYALPHKGARARCCLAFFGRNRARNDQRHLLSRTGSISRNSFAMTPISSDAGLNDGNGINLSGGVSNGRTNSVSPI